MIGVQITPRNQPNRAHFKSRSHLARFQKYGYLIMIFGSREIRECCNFRFWLSDCFEMLREIKGRIQGYCT